MTIKKNWIAKIVITHRYEIKNDKKRKLFHCEAFSRNGKNLFTSEANGYSKQNAQAWVDNLLDGLKYEPKVIWE